MELLLLYFGHILTSQTLYNLIFFVSRLLNGNELTGSLPEELGYLPKLDRIQIDQNYISGSLPKSFANLNKTRHLWEFSDATCPKTAGCLSSCFTIFFFFFWCSYSFLFSSSWIATWTTIQLVGKSHLNSPDCQVLFICKLIVDNFLLFSASFIFNIIEIFKSLQLLFHCSSFLFLVN